MRLVIASRQSSLAKIQAYAVAEAIQKIAPSLKIEHEFKSSLGDQNLDQPLWQSPEKGVFTNDFRESLVSGEVDLVVHSWKDLPIETNLETMVAATLPREDARDMFFLSEQGYENVLRNKVLKVLTSSPRRIYNLEKYFSDFLPMDIEAVDFSCVRGNIATRIGKLLKGEGDVLIVAKAAIDRLHSQTRFTDESELISKLYRQCRWQVLPIQVNPCAAGQGALAIEIKRSRSELQEILKRVNCQKTFKQVSTERNILKFYGGGCHQKIGCHVMTHEGLELISLKGVTEKGRVLSKWQWTKDIEFDFRQIGPSQVWPNKEMELFGREQLDIDIEELKKNKGFFVSRISAWPKDYVPTKGQFVWAAGLKTMRSLAQLGVWCNGTSEGLGINSELTLATPMVNLTHDRAKSASSVHTQISTYKLVDKPIEPSPQGYEYFFWTSGSRFLRVFQEYPEIKNGTHFCMPGASYKLIKKYIDRPKIHLVFNQQHLLQKLQNQ